MSSSLGSSSLLVLLLVLLFSSLSQSSPSFSSKITSELLNDVCSKTRNSSFCLGVFNSNPKTPRADINGLCQISIDMARDKALDTYKILDSLVKTTTDPPLKERYSSCYKNYEDAIGFLYRATTNLIAGDPNGVNVAATDVMLQVDNCQGNFRQPQADPASMLKKNQILVDLSAIIVVVANRILNHA